MLVSVKVSEIFFSRSGKKLLSQGPGYRLERETVDQVLGVTGFSDTPDHSTNKPKALPNNSSLTIASTFNDIALIY